MGQREPFCLAPTAGSCPLLPKTDRKFPAGERRPRVFRVALGTRIRHGCAAGRRCARRTNRAQKYHPSSQLEYHPALAEQPKLLKIFGAGEGNRTLVISLEGCCSSNMESAAVSHVPYLSRASNTASQAANCPHPDRREMLIWSKESNYANLNEMAAVWSDQARPKV